MVKSEDRFAASFASPGPFPGKVGERLAAARQAQGLSLDDIVARTRVPRRHLEMIEAGNHSALPAIPYSAGFVKTYAKTLGLDGAELARDFRQEVSQVEQVRYIPEPFQPADPARMPSRLLAFVALGVAVLLAVTYAVWRSSAAPDDPASLAAETAAPAVGAAAATSPTAPAAAGTTVAIPLASATVAVTAREPVWVKIYDGAGGTLFQGEMAAGQRFEVPSNAVDPLIWTGRPQALQLSVGATAIPALGVPDRTIRDVSLKRDALLARLAPSPAPSPAASAASNPARPQP